MTLVESDHSLPNLERSAVGNATLEPLVVMLTLTFNFMLCFINSRHWASMTTAYVAVVQILLLCSAVILGRQNLNASLLAYALVIIGAILSLRLFNNDIDLKVLFDLAVGPAFWMLGRQSSVAQTTRLLGVVLTIVVAVGLFELIFSDWYQSVFDVFNYYIDKGTVAAGSTTYDGTNAFSGSRSDGMGRTLFANVFGLRRASSVFLEPVSMGNFPVICLAWLLSVQIPHRPTRIALYALTTMCVILPDARYGLFACSLLIAARIAGLHRVQIITALLPAATITGLYLLGCVALADGEYPRMLSDDIVGRLLLSGKLLAYWSPANWLALSPSPIYVLDNGYAYIISNAGVLVVALAWFAFALSKPLTDAARSFRGLAVIYLSTSLAINGSAFSIKTAALLWFMYGAAQAGSQLRTTRSSAPLPSGVPSIRVGTRSLALTTTIAP